MPAEAREPQGWLVLTLHLTQHSLTPLAGTPRPEQAGPPKGTAKAGRHWDTQLLPADLFVPSGEGPTVEGSREGEKQNPRLEAVTPGPKDGCCGLSSGPPGLSLKRLPVPSPLLLHRGLEPQWP